MNANSTRKAAILRKEVRKLMPSMGGDYLAAQASLIENNSERKAVEMQFTSKWESNDSFRLFRL